MTSNQTPSVFELQLIGSALGYLQVRVDYPLCGERHHHMVPPYDDVTTGALLKLLEPRTAASAPLENLEELALQDLGFIRHGNVIGVKALTESIGHQLYHSLFPTSEDRDEDIRGAFKLALDYTQHVNQPLPFQLRFDSRAVDLACLPWELICDEIGPLVASGRLSFTRYITFGQPTRDLPIVDRLAVITVSPRPKNLAHLDATAESQAIQHAFVKLEQQDLIRLKVLTRPTLPALVRAINRYPYHILHFDGHGGYVRRCPRCDRLQPADRAECSDPTCREPLDGTEPRGCLAFEKQEDSKQKDLVTARTLATVLSRSQIRLCVISACQSTTLSGTSVFNSVGPKLVEAGVPAVVGMQFPLQASDAVTFIEEFYAGLAREQSIAAATDASRRLLFTQGLWYIPTIYLRNKDGQGFLFRFHDTAKLKRHGYAEIDVRGTGIYLLPAGLESHEPAFASVDRTSPYRRLRAFSVADHPLFFGRETATDDLFARVIDPEQRFTVVLGPAGVGKTSVIHAGLIPMLLSSGYLVLSLREYSEPVALLCHALAESKMIDIALSGVEDLPTVVDLLIRNIERPLLFVFDEFGEFLGQDKQSHIKTFARQLAACLETVYPRPVHFLFALREDQQSQLGTLHEWIPHIFDRPFLVKALQPSRAEQAITHPLSRCRLPIAYDTEFVEKTLLPELMTSTADVLRGTISNSINPTFLQIVCDDLFQTARHRLPAQESGTIFVIGEELYAQRRTSLILKSYLDQQLSLHFLDRSRLQSARALLKQMVNHLGERQFRSRNELIRRAGVEEGETEQVLATLTTDGLLELRTRPDAKTEYSVGHRFIAQQITAWFDPQEALVRCAQDVLNQAWHSWQARWEIAKQETTGHTPDVRELLIGPDHLRDIRRAQHQPTDRAPRLHVSALEHCLLLRSAVHHRVDMDYWSHDIQQTPISLRLLAAIDEGSSAPGTDLAQEDVAMGATVLGLSATEDEGCALARAAVAESVGEVRHVAALGLASLGLQVVANSEPILKSARPTGKYWRYAQALAQMQAACFALPQLPFQTRWPVQIWSTMIAAWDSRWPLLVESICAGIGAGLSLNLCMLILALSECMPALAMSSVYYQPLGIVAGMLAVVLTWLLFLPDRPHGGFRRVAGIGFGFVLGVVVVWLPLALTSLYVSGYLSPNQVHIVFYQHAVGGLFWGTGIAFGGEAAARFRPRIGLWSAFASGIGGLFGGLLAVAIRVGIPFVDPGAPLSTQIWKVALFTFTVGVGFSLGWMFGTRLWNRFLPV